jgi:methionine synthase II (cobalamin-independent)
VVNQKVQRVEGVEEVLARAERAVQRFGSERVLLNPAGRGPRAVVAP